MPGSVLVFYSIASYNPNTGLDIGSTTSFPNTHKGCRVSERPSNLPTGPTVQTRPPVYWTRGSSLSSPDTCGIAGKQMSVCACTLTHAHTDTRMHIYTHSHTQYSHTCKLIHTGQWKGMWLCLCELLWVTTSHCGLRTYLMSVFNFKFLLRSIYVLLFWLSPNGILTWPKRCSQKMEIYIQ